MRRVYLHDGTFEGLLTAVARAVKAEGKIHGVYSQKNFSPQLFDAPENLDTDAEQAKKLFDYLKKLGGLSIRFAMDGYLSEDCEVGVHLQEMVNLCLIHGGGATQIYSNSSIQYLDTLSKRVRFEAHRFTGLIRFRILVDGVQYAPFEPDNIIIGYLADHFKKRFHNNRWILHDTRRNLALYWDRDNLQSIDIDEEFTTHVVAHGEIEEGRLTESESYYQQLWTTFHGAISNAKRKNLNLQRQYMPKRYWKYLVEMK